VASAVDNSHSTAPSPVIPAKTPEAITRPSSNLNPIAYEVAVIATGARPGKSGGQRELFTEETGTVLVFENGGVLRLSAAVVPGQLLFLTNKETKREVVAQVTRKRDFRPTNCYVEVEFSEPSPGFWGIEFPEMRDFAPASAQEQEAAELVQGAEAIADEPTAPAPAPSAQEVSALKHEVEALREQLKLLQTQTGAGNSSAPSMTPIPSRVSAKSDAKSKQSPNLASASSEARVNAPVPAPPVSSALPLDDAASPSSEEPHSPKPVIRVNRAKSRANRSSEPNANSGVITRPGALRIALLSAVLLLAATGAAWYLHWIPWLAQPKKLSAAAASTVTAHLAPAVNSAPQKTANANSDSSGKTTRASDAPAPQPGAAVHDASQPTAQPAPAGDASPFALAVSQPAAAGDATVDPAALLEKSVIAAPPGKHPVPRSPNKGAAVSAAPSS
jgi:hypothetical protein